MDPGNWATSLAGGSKFGYALLTIALMSNIMAIVLQALCARLGIAAGRTSSDGAYTLEKVNCLGACALAPLAVVDGRYHGQMTDAKVEAVLAEVKKNGAA